MRFALEPLDDALILGSAARTGHVITVEEHYLRGGLGGAVAELLGGAGVAVLDRVAVPHEYVPSGPYEELLRSYDLDAAGLERRIAGLVARIRAVLRRHDAIPAQAAAASAKTFVFGPFVVNLDTRMLSRDGAEIALTGGEYELLEIFVAHANRALSRDWLMDQLRGFERDPFDRSIDVHVSRIRAVIEDDPKSPKRLLTVRGAGYVFARKQDGEA